MAGHYSSGDRVVLVAVAVDNVSSPSVLFVSVLALQRAAPLHEGNPRNALSCVVLETCVVAQMHRSL